MPAASLRAAVGFLTRVPAGRVQAAVAILADMATFESAGVTDAGR